MPQKTIRTLVHFLAAVGLMLAVVLTEPRIYANEHVRTLGKDMLGKSLKEFQSRFPKAICGSAAASKTKPRNLTNAKVTGTIYCYLDDHDSLTRISPSPILNLDVRAVSAIFWKSRLYNLMFDLNVRSIRTVLSSFEKIYGPPILMAMDDPADRMKLTYVSWTEVGTELQVHLSHLGGEAGAETVYVDLWSTEGGTIEK